MQDTVNNINYDMAKHIIYSRFHAGDYTNLPYIDGNGSGEGDTEYYRELTPYGDGSIYLYLCSLPIIDEGFLCVCI